MGRHVLLGWILAGWTAALAVQAPAQSPPPLPPGVRLAESPATVALPFGMRVAWLDVDWTHPLLAAELVSGFDSEAAPPVPWNRLAAQRPETLFVTLVEPESDGERWRPAIPLAGDARGEAPAVWLYPDFPWTFEPPAAGFTADADADARRGPPVAPLRALLRRADLATQWPDVAYRDRCLISLTNPATGRTRFALVERPTPGEGRTGELAAWLRAAAMPGEWIALHSLGPDAIVGQGDWRLTPPAAPRRMERAGLLLALRSRRVGEPVDWVRMPGAHASASSMERDFPPAALTVGRLGTLALAPRVWMSLASDAEPWIEVRFDDVRPIRRIAVAWASAAGWSAHFNPARAVLRVADRNGAWQTVAQWDAPASALSTWTSAPPARLHRIRLELPEPSQMPLDGRARVGALQAWGPWDGADAGR